MIDDCPACGFGLKGHKNTGFRCVRCHARYTTPFLRKLRTKLHREKLKKHFGEPEPPEEVTIITEDVSVTEALARESIEDALISDSVDEEISVDREFSTDDFVKERAGY